MMFSWVIPRCRTLLNQGFNFRQTFRGMKSKTNDQSLKFTLSGVEKKAIEASFEKNFWEWCTTETGRIKIGRIAVFGGGGTLLTCTFCWNIYMVDATRQLYMVSDVEGQLDGKIYIQKEKKAGLMSQQFLRLFANCQARAEVSDDNFSRIDIFYSASLDPVSQGLSCSKQGAVVGFPRAMLEEQDDITSLRLKPFFNYFHKGYRIPSNLCEEAKSDLRQTLLLTPEEQEFAMSRELAMVDSWAALRETVAYPLLFVSHYMFARNLNTRLGLITKSRIYRWPIQAALGSFVMLLALQFKTLSSFETETDAITTVCKTREQAEIGVGFYQKLIDRNKVLYQVLGAESDGGYCFTAEGEYTPSMFDISVINTLKAKREFCRSLAHKLE